MRANYDTTITGTKCILVPYRREHVETYHAWMQGARVRVRRLRG
jgi:hypothetical protein